MKSQLMIIEKDRRFRRQLLMHIGIRDFVVFGVDKQDTAVALLKANRMNAIILSLTSMGEGGLEMLETVQGVCPDLPVIVINTAQQLSLSITCMRRGVWGDFLLPLDVDALVASIRKAAALPAAYHGGTDTPQRQMPFISKPAGIHVVGESYAD